jgi:hypothetical protein
VGRNLGLASSSKRNALGASDVMDMRCSSDRFHCAVPKLKFTLSPVSLQCNSFPLRPNRVIRSMRIVDTCASG